ncbi:class I SAM-dependent methyltransferase [Solihabitans fulvus]|uniref:Class I SAM-dependent methyltransferase n=1 Tax=Solihabitans fulvus TaxID=1892852 RepID=A0A5B2X773_9PSEU|nr:class I SAM-dependent methyltransferase [Solihabitans fulvus]KAA2258742.1 class I SAM-dependent methyltransferase [Solihabitans fulvus]
MVNESASNDLARNWEQYWLDLPSAPGAAIWDSDPSVNVARHHAWFGEHFAPTLPVLDIGCGNGTQTRFLGERYDRVIGLDVAEAAIALARGTHGDVAEFRRLDLLDPAAVEALHAEVGDANVYVRAVLHQLPASARPAAAAALARLAGESGHLFDIELAPNAGSVFRDVLSVDGSVPKLREVLAHGIAPAELADGEFERLLADAGLSVVDGGRSTLPSTEHLPDGERLEIPLQYLVARRGRA